LVFLLYTLNRNKFTCCTCNFVLIYY